MKKSTYHIFFGNLSNPLRISILLSLREKERSVSELSKELSIEQSKISHALSSMKKCNIIKAKQRGKSRIYSLNKKTMSPILNLIDKHAETFCGGNCVMCKGCG